MVSKGYISSTDREGQEFYMITEEGYGVLASAASRFEEEYSFIQRYFQTILKWIPSDIKAKFITTFIDNMKGTPTMLNVSSMMDSTLTDNQKRVLVDILIMNNQRNAELLNKYKEELKIE
jgi:hypothetical protein